MTTWAPWMGVIVMLKEITSILIEAFHEWIKQTLSKFVCICDEASLREYVESTHSRAHSRTELQGRLTGVQQSGLYHPLWRMEEVMKNQFVCWVFFLHAAGQGWVVIVHLDQTVLHVEASTFVRFLHSIIQAFPLHLTHICEWKRMWLIHGSLNMCIPFVFRAPHACHARLLSHLFILHWLSLTQSTRQPAALVKTG